MKNKIYLVYDETNDIAVNCFISITNDLAKNQVVSNLKQQIYLFQNTTNLAQKAQLINGLANAQNYILYEIQNEKEPVEILKYKEVLKPYEKQIKLTKKDVENEIKQSKN